MAEHDWQFVGVEEGEGRAVEVFECIYCAARREGLGSLEKGDQCPGRMTKSEFIRESLLVTTVTIATVAALIIWMVSLK